jgi:hypothetical protein
LGIVEAIALAARAGGHGEIAELATRAAAMLAGELGPQAPRPRTPGAKRQARYRERHRGRYGPSPVTSPVTSPGVTSDVTGDASREDQERDLLSDHDLRERERETRGVTPTVTPVTPVTPRDAPPSSRPSLAPVPRLIDPSLTLDADSRAAAEQLGIREVEIEWRRFVDKCLARGELAIDFRALFRSRLAFIRNDQRRERQRDAAVPSPRQDGPGNAGKAAEAPEAIAARQRARDAEHARVRRQAAAPEVVGAAVGSVLSQLNGGHPPPPAATRAGPGPAKTAPALTPTLSDDEIEAKRQSGLRALEGFEDIEQRTAKDERGNEA